jgi:hypothetical protein
MTILLTWSKQQARGQTPPPAQSLQSHYRGTTDVAPLADRVNGQDLSGRAPAHPWACVALASVAMSAFDWLKT